MAGRPLPFTQIHRDNMKKLRATESDLVEVHNDNRSSRAIGGTCNGGPAERDIHGLR